MKKIYVEWLDAEQDNDWLTEEELSDFLDKGSNLIRQSGFFVKETDDYLVMCFSYSVNGAGQRSYNDVIRIPNKWILKKEMDVATPQPSDS